MLRRALREVDSERLVEAKDSDSSDAEIITDRESFCSSNRALICFESFSRVDNAS